MLRKTQLLRRKNETGTMQHDSGVLSGLVIKFMRLLGEFFRLNYRPSKLRRRGLIKTIRIR